MCGCGKSSTTSRSRAVGAAPRASKAAAPQQQASVAPTVSEIDRKRIKKLQQQAILRKFGKLK